MIANNENEQILIINLGSEHIQLKNENCLYECSLTTIRINRFNGKVDMTSPIYGVSQSIDFLGELIKNNYEVISQYKRVYLCGFCGSDSADLKCGDVLIPRKIYSGDAENKYQNSYWELDTNSFNEIERFGVKTSIHTTVFGVHDIDTFWPTYKNLKWSPFVQTYDLEVVHCIKLLEKIGITPIPVLKCIDNPNRPLCSIPKKSEIEKYSSRNDLYKVINNLDEKRLQLKYNKVYNSSYIKSCLSEVIDWNNANLLQIISQIMLFLKDMPIENISSLINMNINGTVVRDSHKILSGNYAQNFGATKYGLIRFLSTMLDSIGINWYIIAGEINNKIEHPAIICHVNDSKYLLDPMLFYEPILISDGFNLESIGFTNVKTRAEYASSQYCVSNIKFYGEIYNISYLTQKIVPRAELDQLEHSQENIYIYSRKDVGTFYKYSNNIHSEFDLYGNLTSEYEVKINDVATYIDKQYNISNKVISYLNGVL